MTSKDPLETHRAELARKHPAYDLFLATEKNGDDDVRREAVQLVETIIEKELSWTTAQESTLAAILASPRPAATLTAWRKAMSGPGTSHKDASVVLNGLGSWLELAREEARQPFLDFLPHLGCCFAGLGTGGVQKILESAREMKTDAISQKLRFVGAYGNTTAAVVRSADRVSHAALLHDRGSMLERLQTALPPGKVRIERDANQLMARLGELSDAADRLGAPTWNAAIELIIRVAENDESSADHAARSMLRVLAARPRDVAEAYVADYNALVQSIGVRCVGFGARRLPKLYQDRGVDPTRKLVRLSCAAGERYGPTAGESFLEGGTSAARG
ncbi:MAG: hypothetical protein GY711_32165 [bacterium]|nr:hypothetical protein [bacterium]